MGLRSLCRRNRRSNRRPLPQVARVLDGAEAAYDDRAAVAGAFELRTCDVYTILVEIDDLARAMKESLASAPSPHDPYQQQQQQQQQQLQQQQQQQQQLLQQQHRDGGGSCRQ